MSVGFDESILTDASFYVALHIIPMTITAITTKCSWGFGCGCRWWCGCCCCRRGGCCGRRSTVFSSWAAHVQAFFSLPTFRTSTSHLGAHRLWSGTMSAVTTVFTKVFFLWSKCTGSSSGNISVSTSTSESFTFTVLHSTWGFPLITMCHQW